MLLRLTPQQIAQLKAKVCRASFYDFLQMFWPVFVTEEPIWNWHIKYLCDHLQGIAERVKNRQPPEYQYEIINIPPGSSKTSIITIAYPLWCWTIDPSQRFICASYALDIADDSAKKTLRILESSLWAEVFPELAPIRKALSHIEITPGGERYTAATGSAVTGKHAHQIIYDDPLNPKKAASETELKEATDFLSQTLSQRKVSRSLTPTVLVMQRLDEQDPTGYLLGKQNEGLTVRQICLPGELTKDVRPAEVAAYYANGLFDPVRLTKQNLLEARAVLGSYGYAGQILQSPTPAEGGIIKREWLRVVGRQMPANAVVKFRIDTAYTDDDSNDACGFLAYYMEQGVMYILNYEHRRLTMPELLEFIPTWVKANGYSRQSTIKIEPKANGISVVQMLEKIPGLNVVRGKAPRDGKDVRLKANSATIEAGKVILHVGPWNEHFIHEVCAFPKAAHDEAVDCLNDAMEEEFIRGSWYGVRRA